MAHNSESQKAVLIVGAGIGGMQSALLLAEAGYPVYLLDAGPAIGGSMHLLDRTFPTDSCGICHMIPGRAAYCPTLECDLHPNIEILPYAEVVGLEGEAGAFTARIRHKPRYVSVERCIDCARCAEVCPAGRPSQYEGDLHREKAIYRPPLRAVPGAYVIDMDACTRCGQCVQVCPTAAIDLDMQPRESEIAVGAVLLSPGFEPFDARLKGEFGFGRYDNVLTSIQFERMVSLAGSTGAHIVRPSDGRTPRRIAFIHCVGSRDVSIGKGYCSSVCCMHTAKQVRVAKELYPELEITVFYMDIRAHGKDFDAYFEQVEKLPGVTYRRSMVSAIHQKLQNRNLDLVYTGEDGQVAEEEFDMAVLVVGFGAPQGAQALGQGLGVALNEYGFGVSRLFAPDQSSREGVFLSGAFREPKDIPETVVEASAAAGSVARFLQGGVRAARQQEEAVERNVTEEWPKVGVFIGDRARQLAAAIDLDGLAAYARSLPNVGLAQVVEGGFGSAGLERIAQIVRQEQLNRVVLAGFADLRSLDAFQRMMRAAQLNPNLLETANLGGELLGAHANNGAMDKARAMVEMAVASAARRRPFRAPGEDLNQRVLVIGGGLAGMTAAVTLADMGHAVDLVERGDELGGQLRHLRRLLDGSDPQAALADLIEEVQKRPRIRVRLGCQVEALEGRLGQFQATLSQGESQVYGAVIVASGGQEAVPTEYLYGQDARVLTQRELELRVLDGEQRPAPGDLQSVVMIQCVGSREPQRPYCSRVCCTKALVNALALKEQNPALNVFVLYREMRAYGFREDVYRRAREKGVVFIRYELEHKPQVEAGDGRLRVHVIEPITGRQVTLPADLLVLSNGIAPNDNVALAQALGVELDSNGFFREEHPKMRPLDFARRGIFVCGLAHSPRAVDETIAMARGAAMRAASLLAPGRVEARPTIAYVNTRLCSACGLCVEACPYGARLLEPGAPYAEVLETVCQGCGICAMVCPNKATRQVGFDYERVFGMLDVAVG